MMKIVLCQINSQYIHSALAPWSLAAAARRYCRLPHLLRVEDANINQPPEEVADRLAAGEPALVGLCCYIWNAAYLRRLLPLLRARLPRAVLLAGGPQASFACGDFWAQNPEFDYLLAGEGERSFSQLLDALEGAGAVREVPGLVWREDGALRQNPPSPPLEELPDPYTADGSPILRPAAAVRSTARSASRGGRTGCGSFRCRR